MHIVHINPVEFTVCSLCKSCLPYKCHCAGVSADVEGVKLDIAVMDAKFGQQSNALANLQVEVSASILRLGLN